MEEHLTRPPRNLPSTGSSDRSGIDDLSSIAKLHSRVLCHDAPRQEYVPFLRDLHETNRRGLNTKPVVVLW